MFNSRYFVCFEEVRYEVNVLAQGPLYTRRSPLYLSNILSTNRISVHLLYIAEKSNPREVSLLENPFSQPLP